MSLDNIKVLVLNDDYVPLSVVGWQKAIKRTLCQSDECEECDGHGFLQHKTCELCGGTGQAQGAVAVEYYDMWIKDSKGREYPIPAVIANKHHTKRLYRKIPYSRVNVYRRDELRCQYCGIQYPASELTLDHVVPRSMWKGPGTPTDWHNIVACCIDCNRKKNNQTPEQAGMQLRKVINGQTVYYKKPKQPTYSEIVLGVSRTRYPDEWKPYLEPIKDRLNAI